MKREGGRIDHARVRVVATGERGLHALEAMLSGNLYGADFIAIHTQMTQAVKSAVSTQIFASDGGDDDDRPAEERPFPSAARQKLYHALSGADMVILVTSLETAACARVAQVVIETTRALDMMSALVVIRPFPAHLQETTHTHMALLQCDVDLLLVIGAQTAAWQQTELDVVRTIHALNNLVNASGLINLDLADLKSTTGGQGTAILTTGEAQGTQYARRAARRALYAHSQGRGIHGARRLLLHLTIGPEANLTDVQDATRILQDVIHPEANIILGVTVDPRFSSKLAVTAVAADFSTEA
ncbi:MAG: hypothetical protein H6660_12080 [Ardenticatenaceae bacterium]|nr:hypothetical protein [Ardenticatenaceae bacterium]